jgi:hypothetical protein
MKIKTLLSISIATCLTACVYVNHETSKDEKDAIDLKAWANEYACEKGWNKFTNEYFAICFPDNWKLDDSGLFGSDVVLTNSNIETISDNRPFSQNINVMKQKESDMTAQDVKNLDEYASFNKEQLEKVLFQADIISFTKTSLGGIPAYKNRMTANQNGADLYFEQYIFKHDSHYFIMTFTAPIETSDESITMANKIMSSLIVNN